MRSIAVKPVVENGDGNPPAREAFGMPAIDTEPGQERSLIEGEKVYVESPGGKGNAGGK